MPNRETDPETIEQRRLGHLLKSVTTTVRETRATDGKPAEVVKKTSVQLHSPAKAAAILARLAGMDRNSEDKG